MRHFREELGSGVFFIAGQDAMEDIGSWKSAATLLKTYNFAISTRPGYDSSALIDLLQGVLAVKYVNVRFKPSRISHGGLVETTGIDGASSEIHIVNTTALDISSSLIREKLRTGRSVKYLVPEAVERYLKDNRASLF